MGNYLRKRDELARILRTLRSQGKTIVFTNGCFDLLHVGHIRCLRDAASRGDYLVVALNSDRSARRLKGAGRPLQPEDERAEIIAAISGVDYVTLFNEDTAEESLRVLRPSMMAKGTNYRLKDLPERIALEELDIEFVRLGDPKNHSTQELIDRAARADSAGQGGGKASPSGKAPKAVKSSAERKPKSPKTKDVGKAKAKAASGKAAPKATSRLSSKVKSRAKAKASSTAPKAAARATPAKKAPRKAPAAKKTAAAAAAGRKSRRVR
jgi:D-beta-D-heptose 7-phosphate kinase/D-beta-D-heptose 1-phosphate adenosyltransferase